MPSSASRITVHMVASLDGFVARRDGRVDWMETADTYAGGASMDPATMAEFLKTIDCYVMGSKTYETALRFESQGFGWAYGDTPTYVLTTRDLPRSRDSIHFRRGDVAALVNDELRPKHHAIWFAGGGDLCGACVRLGLADEIRFSILPVLIGDGIPFFSDLDGDVPLHLVDTTAYKNGMVELRYEIVRADRT